jgi:hypothetical protein
MNVLIDLLGALMIATLLLLMMITFQMQLRDTADRTIFAAQMMKHEQNVCKELNNIIALVGVGYSKNDIVVTTATSTHLAFHTFWDYKNNVKTSVANTIDLSLDTLQTDVGKSLNILQSASPVYDLGSILWLDDLSFVYYDTLGVSLGSNVTGDTRRNIYSMDIKMTLKRNAPMANATALRTKVQLRCYMMNRYLRYAID